MIKKILWALLIIAVVGIAALYWQLSSWVDAAFTPPSNAPESELFEQYQAKSTASVNPADIIEAIAPSSTFNAQALVSPQENHKPWTRWWWPGGLVEVDELKRQLDQIKQAGFGGVEIQAFSMGTKDLLSNAEITQLRTFGTQAFDAKVAQLIEHANTIDVKVDLTNGSGWPAGGPHIAIENGLQTLTFGHMHISNSGTESNIQEIAPPSPVANANDYGNLIIEALFESDIANFDISQRELIAVLAAPYATGELSNNPFTIDDTIVLQDEEILDITSLFDTNTSENSPDQNTQSRYWDVPPGDWVIIAVYRQPAGEAPVLTANKTSGFIVNHLDQDVLNKHYDFTLANTSYRRLLGKGIHGIFNDSLEFKLNRMSSNDIMDEFKRLRGYDLKPHLPFVFFDGADNFYLTDAFLQFSAAPDFSRNENDARIRHDYQQTLSDLIIDRFIAGSAQWLGSRGVLSRAQSYGMDIDIIQGLGANHIPETEQLYAGGSNNFLKMTGAAAALYKRNIATAESFVWQGKDLVSSPWKLKVGADKLFAAGINRIIYHGTTYQLPDDNGRFGPANWYPWSSPASPLTFGTNVSPNTFLWQSVDELNGYFSRVQAVLQQGKPAYDVFIYYPFLGVPSAHERDITSGSETLLAGHVHDLEAMPPGLENPIGELLFDTPTPDKRNVWFNKVQPLIHAIEQQGLTWTWTNADALERGSEVLDKRTVVFADVESVPRSLAEHMSSAQHNFFGLILGNAPAQQNSFFDFAVGDAAVQSTFTALPQATSLETAINTIVANYKDTQAIDVNIAIGSYTDTSAQNAADNAKGEFPVKQMQREFDTGHAIFFANQGNSNAIVSLNYPEDHTLLWYDAGANSFNEDAEASGSSFTLLPYQSVIALVLDSTVDIEHFSTLVQAEPLATGAAISGTELSWTWKDTNSDSAQTAPLKAPAAIATYGEVVYEAQFDYAPDSSASKATKTLLHTSRFIGHGNIFVNGQAAGAWVLPPYTTDLSPYLQTGSNRIEIRSTVPWHNAMLQDYKAGDESVKQLANRETNVAVGIVDPVYVWSAE